MNSPFRKLYSVPVIGYAWRLVAGLLRLPTIVRSYEETFGDLHAWRASTDAKIGSASAAIDALTADIHRAREQIGVETGQFRSHFAEQQGIAPRVLALEQQLAQVRAAFEQHVPSLLNVVSSHAASARLLRREQAAIQERTASAEQRVIAVEARIDALAHQLEDASATMRDGVGALQSAVVAHDARNAELTTSLEALREALQANDGRDAQTATLLSAVQRTLDEHRAQIEASPASAAGGVTPDAFGGLASQVKGLEGTVQYLLERVEFVRRETLFELRYGREPALAAQDRGDAAVEARILNEKKVKAALAKGLRLNVGCGHIPMDGYVNVDRRELPHVDVIAEANHMPFAKGSVAELYSAHLVEHFPKEQLRREVLPYWKSLLRAGGVLRCVVPDSRSMIEKYVQGEMKFEDLREVTYGSQDYAGDFHYNMFTPESLREVLEEAGFTDVSFPAIGRVNGLCLEMEAVARA